MIVYCVEIPMATPLNRDLTVPLVNRASLDMFALTFMMVSSLLTLVYIHFIYRHLSRCSGALRWLSSEDAVPYHHSYPPSRTYPSRFPIATRSIVRHQKLYKIFILCLIVQKYLNSMQGTNKLPNHWSCRGRG